MLRSAALAGALLCSSVSAQALTPVAQDRHVHARHEDGFGNLQQILGSPATETLSAPDYAPFSASADGYPPPFAYFEIVATQSSTIGADQLDASGSTESSPGGNPIDGDLVTGESLDSVTFQVETLVPTHWSARSI